MIRSQADIASGLEALKLLDKRLHKVIDMAGPVPFRQTPSGLRGLSSTIVAQQVSRASADAIFGRLEKAVDLNDAAALLHASSDIFRAAGLSRPKERTLRAIAEAVCEKQLDLESIASFSPREATTRLTSVHGIGVWTAECYLLFAAGHADIFPAGDLALAHAVAHAFQLDSRPKEKMLKTLSQAWAPHRSTAARLFWAYYHQITRRDGAPLLRK